MVVYIALHWMALTLSNLVKEVAVEVYYALHPSSLTTDSNGYVLYLRNLTIVCQSLIKLENLLIVWIFQSIMASCMVLIIME